MSLLPLILSCAIAQASEVQLWVEVPTAADEALLRSLPLGFAEGTRPGAVRMVGESGVERQLDAVGLRWQVLPAPPPSPPGYTTTDEMVDKLTTLAESYPDLAELVHAGWSVEGRPLLALRLSAVGSGEARIGWRVLGAHHGDELSSAELALHTAERLLEDHGSEPRATEILDRDEVWVWPHVNPDGVAAATRSNARGVDLNRNYAHEWTAEAYAAGPRPFSEPETRAVRAVSTWSALGAGLSMHSGAANLGWVWNHTTARTADESLLAERAEDYAALCGVEDFWVTNGADWYVTTGDTNDWSYGRHGVLDYTLEASEVKSPAAADIPALLDDHIDAVIDFLDEEQAVWGQVLGPDGAGLPAQVQVDGSPPLSTGPGGRFGRPVGSGPWLLEVQAHGFEPVQLELTEDELPVEVRLETPTARLGPPSPALLPRGTEGWFELPGAPDGLELVRHGEVSVPLEPADGGWLVPVDELAPGPWSLRAPTTGAVQPHAVFIGEHADAPMVELIAVDNENATLQLSGSAAGVRAWTFTGPHRQPTALKVHATESGELRIELPDAVPDPLDVLLWAEGHQLALLNLNGDPTIDQPRDFDTGTAPHDTGPSPVSAQATGELTACSCSLASAPALPAVLLPALFLARRRRRPS